MYKAAMQKYPRLQIGKAYYRLRVVSFYVPKLKSRHGTGNCDVRTSTWQQAFQVYVDNRLPFPIKLKKQN